MYNYKIKTSFVIPEMSKALANKTVFTIMIVEFNIRRELDLIHFFSMPWNRFQFSGY